MKYISQSKIRQSLKPHWVEQSVLFASILKWFLIASVIGVITGASTAFFLFLLNNVSAVLLHWPLYFLLLPLGMFLSSLCTTYLSKEAEGHGTEQVIESIHQRGGKINPAVVPVKLLATIITLATGGSAGKEGPCAQIGAGLSSLFADLVKSSMVDRKKLVICGISAGFSAVFGTPVAGALFGVEVLAIGQIQYAVLFPSFVSGIIAYEVSSALGTTYFHATNHIFHAFSELFFSEVVLIGIACGICSLLFIEIVKGFHNLSHRLPMWKPLKAVIGGLLVLLTALFSKSYLGLGMPMIESVLKGEQISHWYDPLLKMYATAVTLGFGGSGGIVTPIFFIGSTFGSFLASVMHLDPSLLSALCLAGVLSGCANTPISASIMAMELFGTDLSPYAAMVCIISFIISGHRSVYPSQLLHMRKSESLMVDTGEAIRNLKPGIFRKHEGS